MSTFADRALAFYRGLRAPRVPDDVEVMNPYRNKATMSMVSAFLDKFFADNNPRVLSFGINPGRFGAGITGVTFADPVALADFCGIPNDMKRRRELSSVFVYDFIKRFGGAAEFHRHFFLTAISPLGYTRGGKNLNYYDVPELARAVTPFIVRTVEQQIALGARRDHAIVLGVGENYKFMRKLNDKHRWFETLHPIDHPRPIMQYRRKRVDEYLDKYVSTFRAVLRDRKSS